MKDLLYRYNNDRLGFIALKELYIELGYRE